MEQETIGVCMGTCILKLNEDNVTKDELAPAIQVLKQGGLVAFPTETVYGLGANALDENAAKKIYEAKGRPSDNPLIVHIAKTDSLNDIAIDIPESAYVLAEAFWPGPLTMILKKSDRVPYGTTGGLNTVAVRMPSHPLAQKLIEASGLYLAAPSANSSGKPSPTKAQHVLEDLDGRIDVLIDAGDSNLGLESTIVDLSGERPCILRPGYITKQMLEQVIGPVEYDSVVMLKQVDQSVKPKAPGMKYKHYAPHGDLTIYEGDSANVVERINADAWKAMQDGKRVGIIATEETKDCYAIGMVKSIGTRQKEDTIASSLYTILREFDSLKADIIYSESFYDDELGQAIMNRLIKASGYQIIKV